MAAEAVHRCRATDINAVLPAKLILMAIALICATAVFSAVAAGLADSGTVVAAVVADCRRRLAVDHRANQRRPTLQRESEYISRSITATQLKLWPDVVTYRNTAVTSPATAQVPTAHLPRTSGYSTRQSLAGVHPVQQGKNFYYFQTSCRSTATSTQR